MTVITGPLMDEELKVEALRLGGEAGVEVLEHVPDLTALMAGADLLVTMTGYNSVNEALAMGCPIVTVPRLGPSAEQRLRAEALEGLGLARYLRREDLSPQTLAKMMTEVPTQPGSGRLKTDGVKTAASMLAGMIADIRQANKERAHA
jgi:predicted glycosyltransferase